MEESPLAPARGIANGLVLSILMIIMGIVGWNIPQSDILAKIVLTVVCACAPPVIIVLFHLL
jgi:hypothetical protein